MSRRLTTIQSRRDPGTRWTGLSQWGNKTREEMVEYARKYHLRKMEEARIALEDLERGDARVFQHDGVHAYKNIKEL